MPVELNIDLGELPDEPEELYALATVVNVACGGHAGDVGSMAHAVERALASGARLAAHPSYPDRPGFGRVSVPMAPSDLAASLHAQCAALAGIARARGGAVRALKPHGALYHDAARSREVALAVIAAASALCQEAPERALVVVGPPGGALLEAARARGLAYAREGFADRAYRPSGGLVPRGEPGALLIEPARCIAQALLLARSGDVETICLHGDTPGALDRARAVRHALETHGLLARPDEGGSMRPAGR